MLVLSLVVVFSGLMVENVIVDMQSFINLIVGETSDSCINVNAEIENEFLQMLNEDSRTKKVYLYHTVEVGHVGGIALVTNLSDDFSNVNNQSVCFEGRFPKYDNEVAIGAKYAKEKNLKIGDEITLTVDGNEVKYIISGFTQMANALGKDCLMTRSGYERMAKLRDLSYYINVSDGVDIDAFYLEVSQQFENNINYVVNSSLVLNATSIVYVSLMTIIVIAILVLSVIVVTFVLYLLVRTMLNNKKRDYGIMKALGFTTAQLVLQTAISFMPTVIFSMIVGLIVSSFIINPLLAIFLGGIGIVKCTFSIPIVFITVVGIGMILLSFAIVCLLSLKIKKISTKELISGE